ncbi:zinc dependent phospholipase C family protein [Paenibacillus sp. 481]|uniref:zinc dependent phospholipase C family protein n=1 Tax=Paenibacillus sp. 481 TaxID=2835869 RepID=UPI001E625748|nr:zinc dependent phospholipase C family protein [Paenibacillus sp. 481]UHA71927.1 hypothetical protein KIK04_14435 [Paenibacillus sp. 481]
MPWPMVHFAIATKVASSKPSPHFLLGSIAPDAIHMRNQITREQKGITHLVSEGKFPSIETVRSHCLEYLSQHTERAWKEFVLGYFAHIYTDIRWTESVYAEFECHYKGDTADIRTTYNREVSQLEFDLLRSNSDYHQIFHHLQKSKPFTIVPFVTETEVRGHRDEKMSWLQDDRNEPKIQPAYFTVEVARDFVNQTANELNALFMDWEISLNIMSERSELL